MMCKNDTFVAKEVSARLTKTCVAIFALAERLQTSANLLSTKFFFQLNMISEILKMNVAVDSISVESLMDPLNLVQSENMKCAS